MNPPSLPCLCLTPQKHADSANSPRNIQYFEGKILKFVQVREFELDHLMPILS